jgi:hypothetical protein
MPATELDSVNILLILLRCVERKRIKLKQLNAIKQHLGESRRAPILSATVGREYMLRHEWKKDGGDDRTTMGDDHGTRNCGECLFKYLIYCWGQDTRKLF